MKIFLYFSLLLIVALVCLQACNGPNPSGPPNDGIQNPKKFLPSPTLTQIPGCAGPMGAVYNSPVSTITPIPLPLDQFVEYQNGIMNSNCFGPITYVVNGFTVYAGNNAPSLPATLELGLYYMDTSYTQHPLGDALQVIPPRFSGWYNVGMPATVVNFGTFSLIVHSLSRNLLIGTYSDTYWDASGSYAGTPVPPSLVPSNSGFTLGPLYAIGLQTICMSCQ